MGAVVVLSFRAEVVYLERRPRTQANNLHALLQTNKYRAAYGFIAARSGIMLRPALVGRTVQLEASIKGDAFFAFAGLRSRQSARP